MNEFAQTIGLVNSVQAQLTTNRTQKHQLESVHLSALKQARLYRLALVLQTGTLVGSVATIVFVRTEEFYSLRQLLPSVLIFVGFVLYQTIKNYTDALYLSKEVELLLKEQERAIDEADAVLFKFEQQEEPS